MFDRAALLRSLATWPIAQQITPATEDSVAARPPILLNIGLRPGRTHDQISDRRRPSQTTGTHSPTRTIMYDQWSVEYSSLTANIYETTRNTRTTACTDNHNHRHPSYDKQHKDHGCILLEGVQLHTITVRPIQEHDCLPPLKPQMVHCQGQQRSQHLAVVRPFIHSHRCLSIRTNQPLGNVPTNRHNLVGAWNLGWHQKTAPRLRWA